MTDSTKVWVDGEVHDAGRARVDALDHGMMVGDGVFETCKVVDGVPFALTRHLRRLARSAAGLGLSTPEESVVRSAVDAVMAAHHDTGGPLVFGRLRITLTAGPGPLGSDRGPDRQTLVVAASTAAPWPAVVRATTVPWTRNERSAAAGLKTTSYAENVVALNRAREHGGSEALFANTRGELCEGTGSNVLVVVDGQLVTPPLTSGCLAGITRELLLEWAAEEGLPIREESVPFGVLESCQEVLLTSSTRDVQALSGVDSRDVPTGPVGQAAVGLFTRRAHLDVDP